MLNPIILSGARRYFCLGLLGLAATCLLSGCEATKSIQVAENTTFILGSLDKIHRPMVRFADDRSEKDKSSVNLLNEYKFGDSQLEPSPPEIVRNAIESYLQKSNASTEVIALLTAQTITLVKFEVTAAGGNLLDGVAKNNPPGMIIFDTAIRGAAQALAGSANIEVSLCIVADDQKLCGFGADTTIPSLGKYSIEPAVKRSITSLLKEVEYASTRPEYGRR